MQIKEFNGQRATSPQEVANILRNILVMEDDVDKDKEHFWVIGVNNRNIIKYVELVTLGLLNRSLVHAREVYRTAIMQGVASIIVGHNHPSGHLRFSPDDNKVTNMLKNAGKLLDISLLDHVLIAGNEHLSFKEEGML